MAPSGVAANAGGLPIATVVHGLCGNGLHVAAKVPKSWRSPWKNGDWLSSKNKWKKAAHIFFDHEIHVHIYIYYMYINSCLILPLLWLWLIIIIIILAGASPGLSRSFATITWNGDPIYLCIIFHQPSWRPTQTLDIPNPPNTWWVSVWNQNFFLRKCLGVENRSSPGVWMSIQNSASKAPSAISFLRSTTMVSTPQGAIFLMTSCTSSSSLEGEIKYPKKYPKMFGSGEIVPLEVYLSLVFQSYLEEG